MPRRVQQTKEGSRARIATVSASPPKKRGLRGRKTGPEHKRRKTTIEFVVGYPWGGNYCRKLRAALRQLGVPTMHDAFNDGSDVESFFISTDRRRLIAARRLIRDYGRHLESDGEDCFEEILKALSDGGVYEVMQDWKHLFWGNDMPKLGLVGVRLELLATRMTPDGEEMTFRVSRRAAHRRAHRA